MEAQWRIWLWRANSNLQIALHSPLMNCIIKRVMNPLKVPFGLRLVSWSIDWPKIWQAPYLPSQVSIWRPGGETRPRLPPSLPSPPLLYCDQRPRPWTRWTMTSWVTWRPGPAERRCAATTETAWTSVVIWAVLVHWATAGRPVRTTSWRPSRAPLAMGWPVSSLACWCSRPFLGSSSRGGGGPTMQGLHLCSIEKSKKVCSEILDTRLAEFACLNSATQQFTSVL